MEFLSVYMAPPISSEVHSMNLQFSSFNPSWFSTLKAPPELLNGLSWLLCEIPLLNTIFLKVMSFPVM